MHPKLLDEIVALSRRRHEQGDHPTEQMPDAEVLENAVVQLAYNGDELNTALLKARGALSNLMLEPHGCSLCDSGVPRNNSKGHQPDCPYVRAADAMDAADVVLTPNARLSGGPPGPSA